MFSRNPISQTIATLFLCFLCTSNINGVEGKISTEEKSAKIIQAKLKDFQNLTVTGPQIISTGFLRSFFKGSQYAAWINTCLNNAYNNANTNDYSHDTRTNTLKITLTSWKEYNDGSQGLLSITTNEIQKTRGVRFDAYDNNLSFNFVLQPNKTIKEINFEATDQLKNTKVKNIMEPWGGIISCYQSTEKNNNVNIFTKYYIRSGNVYREVWKITYDWAKLKNKVWTFFSKKKQLQGIKTQPMPTEEIQSQATEELKQEQQIQGIKQKQKEIPDIQLTTHEQAMTPENVEPVIISHKKLPKIIPTGEEAEKIETEKEAILETIIETEREQKFTNFMDKVFIDDSDKKSQLLRHRNWLQEILLSFRDEQIKTNCLKILISKTADTNSFTSIEPLLTSVFASLAEESRTTHLTLLIFTRLTNIPFKIISPWLTTVFGSLKKEENKKTVLSEYITYLSRFKQEIEIYTDWLQQKINNLSAEKKTLLSTNLVKQLLTTSNVFGYDNLNERGKKVITKIYQNIQSDFERIKVLKDLKIVLSDQRKRKYLYKPNDWLPQLCETLKDDASYKAQALNLLIDTYKLVDDDNKQLIPFDLYKEFINPTYLTDDESRISVLKTLTEGQWGYRSFEAKIDFRDYKELLKNMLTAMGTNVISDSQFNTDMETFLTTFITQHTDAFTEFKDSIKKLLQTMEDKDKQTIVFNSLISNLPDQFNTYKDWISFEKLAPNYNKLKILNELIKSKNISFDNYKNWLKDTYFQDNPEGEIRSDSKDSCLQEILTTLITEKPENFDIYKDILQEIFKKFESDYKKEGVLITLIKQKKIAFSTYKKILEEEALKLTYKDEIAKALAESTHIKYESFKALLNKLMANLESIEDLEKQILTLLLKTHTTEFTLYADWLEKFITNTKENLFLQRRLLLDVVNNIDFAVYKEWLAEILAKLNNPENITNPVIKEIQKKDDKNAGKFEELLEEKKAISTFVGNTLGKVIKQNPTEEPKPEEKK